MRIPIEFLLNRGHPEGGGNGGEYGDYDVQDFAPKVFVHGFLIF